MLDLSAHVFYKAHFTLEANRGDIDPLKYLVFTVIHDWLVNKYSHNTAHNIHLWNWKQVMNGGDFSAGTVSMHASSYIPEADENLPYKRYWACRIHEVQQRAGIASRNWITEIGFQQINDKTGVFSYVVYYLNGTGFFGPTAEVPAPNIPNIIKSLLSCHAVSCRMGSSYLDNKVNYINVGYAHYFANFLMSKDREVPVILLVGKRVESDADENQEITKASLNPVGVLRNVAGNALVYYAKDPAFSEEFSYLIDSKYWCKPGYIRIYYPRLNPEDDNDGRKQRYFTPYDIEALTEVGVLNIFRRIFSREIEYYNEQHMLRCENCEQLAQRASVRLLRRNYESKVAEVKSNEENSEFYEKYIEELEKKQASIESENAQYKTDMAQIRDELRSANATISGRQEEFDNLYARVRDQDKALETAQILHEFPNTPLSVASFYATVFADKIAFTDRAIETLKECNTDPALLWECFYHMATLLRNLYITKEHNLAQCFQEQSGFELAKGEGPTTRKNPTFMRLRQDTFMGKDIFAEAHVKKGTRDADPLSVRVYYAFIANEQKIVISYCNGRHLPNASTRNI